MWTRYSATGALSRAFNRWLASDGHAVFIAPGPAVPEFATDSGVKYTPMGPVQTKPSAHEVGPEVALAALANRRSPLPLPARLPDGDLAYVLDACEKYLAEWIIDVPAGVPGNDARSHVLRAYVGFVAGNTGAPRLSAQLVAKLVPTADVDAVERMAGEDSPFNASFGQAAIRRRDELLARQVTEKREEKRAEDHGKRPNTKTNRERGVYAFRQPVLNDKSLLFGEPECIHAGFKYYVRSLDEVGWIDVPAATFPDFELLPDEHVIDAPMCKMRCRPVHDGSSAAIAELVLRARAGHVDGRTIEPSETVDDESLEGEYRIKLAAKTARVWFDYGKRDVTYSALGRGLLLSPAVAEEVAFDLQRPDMARQIALNPESTPETRRAWEEQRRDGIRAGIARAMSGDAAYHSPGELVVQASEQELDRLAIETGRDPLGAVLARIVGASREITSEEIDRALREAKAIEGPTRPTLLERISKAMARIGFTKKNVPSEENPSGKAKAFVRGT